MSRPTHDWAYDPREEELMDSIWQQMHEEQQRWESLPAEERERILQQQWLTLSTKGSK